MRLCRYLVLLFMLTAGSTGAIADSWAPPKRTTVYSSDQTHRFTMTPRDLSSSLDYFQDAVKGKDRPGQRPGKANKAARGHLERKSAAGDWLTVWDKPLVNDVAPVDTIVSNSGKFVATLDNWHFMGHGEHVVVIYNVDGSLVRSLKLIDLLPDYYVKALPHTTSSIHWRRDGRFSAEEGLILEVLVPTRFGMGAARSDDHRFVDLVVEPTSGGISPKVMLEWQSALADARRTASEVEEHDREERAFFTMPLIGPSSSDEKAWHRYLREAFYRLDFDWRDDSPDTKVLRSPESLEYAKSLEWLRDSLSEKDWPASGLMIASPNSNENLVKELTAIVSKMRPGALKKARIYVASPPMYRERLFRALAPTGAKLIHIDPSQPIPQRPDRLAQWTSVTE